MGNEEKTLPPGDQRQIEPPGPSIASHLTVTGRRPLADTDPQSIAARQEMPVIESAPVDFGNYELLREVAAGGMGVVYRARHKRLDRICALKMILAGQLAGPGEVERFYDEAKAAARLKHPGIVPVYEVGEVDQQHFFTMGFVEGHSLQQEINEHPLETNRAAKIASQIAGAIAYAHEQKIVHRDLKPANVLIDECGNALVTDFGLAKFQTANADRDESGEPLGTPSYMSPEQAAGRIEEVGELSDVYSLGAILYCMLTGVPPFQAASPVDTMIQVLEKEIVPPSRINPSVSPDIEAITLKCLSKNPHLRYQSATELEEDLNHFLAGRPITARKLSDHDRWVKWCLREPWLAAAVIAMMLFGSTVLATVAINPRLIGDAYRSWADSVVAQGILLGMFISIFGFAVFQAVKTIRDQSGIKFGLIRVLTVIPVGFIGLSVVVAVLRLILMMFVTDYDLFYDNPEHKDLGEALQDGINGLKGGEDE